MRRRRSRGRRRRSGFIAAARLKVLEEKLMDAARIYLGIVEV